MKMIENMSDRLNENIPEVPHSLQSINNTKDVFKDRASYSKKLSNVAKGRLLEIPVGIQIDVLKLGLHDDTKIFNWKNKELGKRECNVPDFSNDTILIEVKNWNCTKYKITVILVESEILKRFNESTDKLKILIISNPKWDIGAKELLIASGVTIIELGYPATEENRVQTNNDINRKLRQLFGLGYYHTNNTKYKMYCNIDNRYNNSILRPAITDSTLTKYIEITDSDSTKTQQKPPLLDCYSCKRRGYCELLQRIDSLHVRKPYKIIEQGSLFPVETTKKIKPFEERLKSWKKEYYPLKAKQFLCLEKRRFLHIMKNYNLFDVEHEEK